MNEIICEQPPTPPSIKKHKLKFVETDKLTDYTIDELPKRSFIQNCKMLWTLLEESDDNILTLKEMGSILGMDYDPQKNKGKKGGNQHIKKTIIEQIDNVKKTIEHYLTNSDKTTKYNYARKNIYKVGRLYSINGIQSLNSNVRGFLFNENDNEDEEYIYADIDMKKSYYTIYLWICKMYNIECDVIIDFVKKYEKYEEEYVNDYVEEKISKVDKSKFDDNNKNKKENKKNNKWTDFVKQLKKSAVADLKKLRCAMLMDFATDSKYDYNKQNDNIKKVREHITRINNDLYRINDF